MAAPKSSKPKLKWNLEQELLLIELYRENEFLWNPKDPLYHKTTHRNSKFDELTAKLGAEYTGNYYLKIY